MAVCCDAMQRRAAAEGRPALPRPTERRGGGGVDKVGDHRSPQELKAAQKGHKKVDNKHINTNIKTARGRVAGHEAHKSTLDCAKRRKQSQNAQKKFKSA